MSVRKPRTFRNATPRSHPLKVSGENDNIRNGVSDEDIDMLANIVLRKTLSIYKASPLYNLNFKKTVLKGLARKICLYIQKVDMWGENEAGVAGQNLIKVNAIPVKGSQNQPSGILVTVTTTTEYGDVDQAEIFWGLFCNPAMENSVTIVPDKFLDLPLVLVKGRSNLIEQILIFFSKQFDCTIEKFYLAPLELTWLGAMWSGYVCEIPCKPLKLVYTPPEEIVGINTVSISINAKSIVALWKCIHDEDVVFLFNEVTAFTKSLEAHLEKYFKLNLENFMLKSIMVTSLHAEASGKIKIFAQKTSYRILAHILTIIQQEMNI